MKNALIALRSAKYEEALAALIDVWRSAPEKRHPRVSDLVGRVSAIVTEARGPVVGRSVKARTAAWMEIAAKKDTADVGRLLATPWPGTWKNAMPVLEALVAFPSDPRIALALAELVSRTPFDTWTSGEFYRVLLAYVANALDARVLPILRADLDLEKSTYWRQGTRPHVERTVDTIERWLESGGPRLTTEEASVVDELEAFFAAERTDERAATKNADDFLAAIYTAPDDDTPRAIYADWLTERGDPRGEFIALQLAHAAGHATEQTKKREAQLLKKHEKKWLAHLETGLAKDGRVFERGFLAHARLDTEGSPKEPPKVFSDPGWATVRSATLCFSIEWRRLGRALLELPSMRWLTEIDGVSRDTALALACGEPRPRIASLEIALDTPREITDEYRVAMRQIADTRALPGLRRLAVLGEPEHAMALLEGTLVAQLERFTVRGFGLPLGGLARLVEARALPLAEIGVSDTNPRVRPDWLIVARRDAKGRFTRLEATDTSPFHVVPRHYHLHRVLRELGPEDVTSFTIDPTLSDGLSADQITDIERELARFTGLEEVVVPWARGRSEEPAAGTAFKLVLSGGPEANEHVADLLRSVMRPPLRLAFDAHAVNGGAEMAIDGDPVALAEAVLAKKRTKSLSLYRHAARETEHLEIKPRDIILRAHASVDELLPWIVDLLRTRPDVVSGGIDFDFPRYVEGGQNYFRRRAPLQATPRFLTVLGGPRHALLPFDEVAKISLPFFRAVRGDRHLLVVLGQHPKDIPSEEDFLAYERALCGAMWAGYRAAWGTSPPELALRALGPILEARGFAPSDDGHGARVRWTAESKASLEVEWVDPLDALRFAIHVDAAPGTATIHGPDGYYAATTREEAIASFAYFAARLERELTTMFTPRRA